MESKQLWTIIGVAAVVAVITCLATLAVVVPGVSLGPQAQLQAYEGKLTEAQVGPLGQVNAHRCSADGVCETNSIKIGNNIIESLDYLGENILATEGFLAEEFVASEVGAFSESLIVGFDENSNNITPEAEIVNGVLTINNIECVNCGPFLLRATVGGENEVTLLEAKTATTICTDKGVGDNCQYHGYLINIRDIHWTPTDEGNRVELGIMSGNAVLVPAAEQLIMTENGEKTTYQTDDMRFLLQPI